MSKSRKIVYSILAFIIIASFTATQVLAFTDTLAEIELEGLLKYRDSLKQPIPDSAVKSIEDQIIEASGGEYADVLINLAKCESTLNPEAIGINGKGNFDAGLFQINSVHTDLSLKEKLDIRTATQWTLDKIKNGEGHIWTCWSKI